MSSLPQEQRSGELGNGDANHNPELGSIAIRKHVHDCLALGHVQCLDELRVLFQTVQLYGCKDMGESALEHPVENVGGECESDGAAQEAELDYGTRCDG